MIYIAPSILAADFSKLGTECEAALAAGADYIHFDVMDGHFVPNLSFGAPVLKSLGKSVRAFYDVHLMISEPQRYLDDFIDAGASMITFHIESEGDPAKTIRQIKCRGCRAGMTLRPKTDVTRLFPYLKEIDMALVMTVEPGFGGQKFMPDMCEKIARLRTELTAQGIGGFLIEADGGIDSATAPAVLAAGANVLVAGSYIFGSRDYAGAVSALKQTASNHKNGKENQWQ